MGFNTDAEPLEKKGVVTASPVDFTFLIMSVVQLVKEIGGEGLFKQPKIWGASPHSTWGI